MGFTSEPIEKENKNGGPGLRTQPPSVESHCGLPEKSHACGAGDTAAVGLKKSLPLQIFAEAFDPAVEGNEGVDVEDPVDEEGGPQEHQQQFRRRKGV